MPRADARLFRLWTWAALALAAPLVAGCGSGPRLTRVSGTVTAEGKPVTNGSITFAPAKGGDGAAANIGADGRYTLSSHQGAEGVRPGTYKVSITAYETPPEMNNPKSGKPAVHPRYFSPETSGLTATVEDRGSQVIDFDLKLK